MDNRIIGTLMRASAMMKIVTAGMINRDVVAPIHNYGKVKIVRDSDAPVQGKVKPPGPYSGVKKHMRWLRRGGSL